MLIWRPPPCYCLSWRFFFRATRKQNLFVRDYISRDYMDAMAKDPTAWGFESTLKRLKIKWFLFFFVRNRVRIIHQYKYLWERRLKGGDVDDFKHKMNQPSSLEGGGRARESVDFISTILFKWLACLLLWVQICDVTGCFVRALPMEKKYRVRQIVHKTARTYINSRTLQAAVSV